MNGGHHISVTHRYEHIHPVRLNDLSEHGNQNDVSSAGTNDIEALKLIVTTIPQLKPAKL